MQIGRKAIYIYEMGNGEQKRKDKIQTNRGVQGQGHFRD